MGENTPAEKKPIPCNQLISYALLISRSILIIPK
jgi:hypothetical protein